MGITRAHLKAISKLSYSNWRFVEQFSYKAQSPDLPQCDYLLAYLADQGIVLADRAIITS
jgi:hypothetical protein